MFYYGLLQILRRTIFVGVYHIADPFWQSAVAVFLVAGFAAFHLKLEPYKAYVLDLLDVVLLGCLSVICVSSLSFQLPKMLATPFSDEGGSNKGFFDTWEYLVYAVVIISIVSSLITIYHEIRLKTLQWLVGGLLDHRAGNGKPTLAHRVLQWQVSFSKRGGDVAKAAAKRSGDAARAAAHKARIPGLTGDSVYIFSQIDLDGDGEITPDELSIYCRDQVCLSTQSSVRPPARPAIRLSVRLSVRPPDRPSVRPSIHPSIRPSCRPAVCPSVRPSVHLSVRP